MGKIETLADFQRWAKIRMIEQNTNQSEVAAVLGTVRPRISEALHGKPSGRKYIEPLIRALGGAPSEFQAVI